ncbi:hypothetical protein Leryth_012642 [Lithospermum erythrorhizon]|nr:hypothetical protein Leryth_012642 [Lithospermum erythrorhizon]
MSSSTPDFEIPDVILSVIPTDPYDQLDLARKITSMAIASRVTNLETEVGRLRQKVNDKDKVIAGLEDNVKQVQGAFQEAELRLKGTLDDNSTIEGEIKLALTTRRLSRDLAKLETFKRQLMQSLSDDSPSPGGTVDIGTYDESVSKGYGLKEEVNGYLKQQSINGSVDSATMDDASRQKYAITQYATPRLTPTGTPKVISTSVSPRGYSTAVSPQKTSGAVSPMKGQYEGSGSISSWFPSSQQSSAANSPPRGRPLPARTPRIDGKEFFRQARSRLSYEQFSAFLANIKELNAQKQTREETLRKAEEIFGNNNKDLYLSFQSLLSRNMR